MGSDPAPDDMRLAGYALLALAEGRPAIVIPGHLKHARMSSHPIDAQARLERPVRSRQVRDECLGDHLADSACCCRVRFFQSRSKRGRVSNVGIRNPPRRACPGRRTCPGPTHLPSPWPAAMSSSASRSPAQPLRREEPRLVGGNRHKAANRDRPVIVDGELHLVALTDVLRA
jgi:hypothetical protein